MSSAADRQIRPGFNFGHPPFGAHYKQDVELGDDGLPLSVDWTKVPGAVWPAQDQGSENPICYILAPVGSIASLNFIKTRKSVVPSSQQVLDCQTHTGGTADGGDPAKVFQFVIDSGGLLPSSKYPFTGEKCKCKKIRGPGVIIDDWRYVEPNSEAALKYAVAFQPVVVSFRAGGRIIVRDTITPFDYYQDGIMKGRSYTKLDHSAALLVGYGVTDLGELYWLLLNSFGLNWGSPNGLFMIVRGTGQRSGALGILRLPCLPLKWSKNRSIFSKCESCVHCFQKTQDLKAKQLPR